MYQSEEKLNEIRKIEQKAQRDEFKAKAFRDATQWKSFNDDYNQQIMFLSILTGEIRTGAPNALEWLVQDDGHGMKLYLNNSAYSLLSFHRFPVLLQYRDPPSVVRRSKI